MSRGSVEFTGHVPETIMRHPSPTRVKASSKVMREIRLIIAFVLMSIALGAAAASIMRGSVSIPAIMTGGSIGFFIAVLCAFGDWTFLDRLRHIPFSAHLLLRTAYYTFVVLAVLAVRSMIIGRHDNTLAGWERDLAAAALITMVLSFASAFVLMLRRMLGPNVLMHFFTGRYHIPVEEERIFMFLDIASSTTIAEKIGNLKFHVFLNEFYYDITGAIMSTRGEIYKYVGDEVIVSWKSSDKTSNGRCILLFFEITGIIEAKKQKYLDKFGYIPGFRAGIHCGPVIVGEMGDYKQEISFLGDTVNTSARIQEACKEHKTNLLVSSELLARVDLPAGYQIKKIGETLLKGKLKPVVLFGIEEQSA
jgi:adenylate cyclase